MSIPILDLSYAGDPGKRGILLEQLRDALFNVGFLYLKNHSVPEEIIANLADKAPDIFDLPQETKDNLSKLNSPHFLGYSGLAEETTQGRLDLREQFDFATELPVVYNEKASAGDDGRDYSKLFWRLRGPNLWPDEEKMPGLKAAVLEYHNALSELSRRFVHLIEEAFDIPVGTCDNFFTSSSLDSTENTGFLHPQHRVKLNKYHVALDGREDQGVGAHKDSSGWLTFLYQVGGEKGLEILDQSGSWTPALPIPNTFVVNFGNAFEAATKGAVRATVHRVRAPQDRDRYSLVFFMGLPVDLKLSEIQARMPREVRAMRRGSDGKAAVEADLPPFLDARWDSLGESMLRKWIRAHPHVALKWYGPQALAYYTQ